MLRKPGKEVKMMATFFLLMYALPYFSCMDQDGSVFDFFDEGFREAAADSFKSENVESDKLSEGWLNYKELSSNIQ